MTPPSYLALTEAGAGGGFGAVTDWPGDDAVGWRSVTVAVRCAEASGAASERAKAAASAEL
jgi:hypothetical protein